MKRERKREEEFFYQRPELLLFFVSPVMENPVTDGDREGQGKNS